MLDYRDIAEEIPQKGEQPHPRQTTKQVIAEEIPVGHPADARHKGGKGAHNGDKPGQEDGLAPVLFEELVGSVQVFLLDPANFSRVGSLTDEVPNPVVDRIPQNRGRRQEDEEHPHVERLEGGESARGKEQRIPRQEGGDDKPRFHEDDEEQQAVGPYAVLSDDLAQVFVQVQEDVHDYT